MIWLLAVLTLSLTIEGLPPDVTFRNNSNKTVTAVRFHLYSAVSRERYFPAGEGIAPGASYPILILLPENQEPELQILGILYEDGSTEGPEASILVASQEGKVAAERLTARQVRTFLQFNSVLDDSAMAVLDRELEETLPIPRQWTTNQQKAAWEDGFKFVRQQTRQTLEQTLPDHRMEQLRKIGGAK